jgi:hypothetical protein
MNVNFDSIFGDIFDAKIEIYVGEQLVQSDNLQAPQIVIEQNYLRLVQQIVADKSRPMSIKLSVAKDIYDDNDNYVRTLWNSVESYNYKKED